MPQRRRHLYPGHFRASSLNPYEQLDGHRRRKLVLGSVATSFLGQTSVTRWAKTGNSTKTLACFGALFPLTTLFQITSMIPFSNSRSQHEFPLKIRGAMF